MRSIAVFPGQGAQHVGMGKDLFNAFKIARETFEEASDAIRVDIKKLCFDGPEADLTLTENTQPCLLTASVATFRVAQTETGYQPEAAAGHSLGEYSALVCAGSIPLPTAVRWVKERGAAMQRAVPQGKGSMAAILGLDDSVITKLCAVATEMAIQKRAERETQETSEDANPVEAIVEPANFNAPGQTVIAGSADAVDFAVSLVKAGGDFTGGKAIPLQVSAPFHCRLMEPAKNRMAELFTLAEASEKPKRPVFPYVPNRTARTNQEEGVIFDFLIEQVDHPVLWRQSISMLLESGFNTAIEFGPGKVLTGLIKRIALNPCTLLSVNDSKGIKSLEEMIKGKIG